jgi:hypothetical protein
MSRRCFLPKQLPFYRTIFAPLLAMITIISTIRWPATTRTILKRREAGDRVYLAEVEPPGRHLVPRVGRSVRVEVAAIVVPYGKQQVEKAQSLHKEVHNKRQMESCGFRHLPTPRRGPLVPARHYEADPKRGTTTRITRPPPKQGHCQTINLCRPRPIRSQYHRPHQVQQASSSTARTSKEVGLALVVRLLLLLNQ